MQRPIRRGASADAGLIFHVFVQDSTSTTGAGKTGLAFSAFSCRYVRNGETLSGAITAQDITTLGTYQAPTANTNIRIKEVDGTNAAGIYEVHIHLDWVNTTNSCQALTIYLSATGAAVLPIQIPLEGINRQDGVRAGLTALPNAAADAAGGLPISDAGALDLDTLLGRLDAAVSTRSTITTAQVNTEVDTALADVNLDHFVGTAAGIPAVPAGTYLDQIMDDGTAAYDRTTDSLQALRDRGDVAWTTGSGTGLTALATGTAQSGGATTIQLASGAVTFDNQYRYCIVNITGGTGIGQSAYVVSSVAATDTLTVAQAWATNPASGSTYEIWGLGVQVFDSDTDTVTLKSGTHTGAVIPTVSTLTGHTPQTGDSYARLGAPAGASIAADVAAVKVDTAAILVDTGTAGVIIAAGQSVSSVSGAVGSVAGNVGGNVVGNVQGSVASVTAGVTVSICNDKTGYSISGTKTTLDALQDVSAALVKTQVTNVLTVDALTEITTPPSGTPTFAQAVMWNYMRGRWRARQSTSLAEVYNAAGSKIAEATASDSGGIFDRLAFAAP